MELLQLETASPAANQRGGIEIKGITIGSIPGVQYADFRYACQQ
jgi:hypothetical protein